MSITKRFISLLSLGILLVAVAIFFNLSLQVFISFNLLISILLLIDVFISNDNKNIEIIRTGEDKLSIFQNEPISFMVYNKSNRMIFFELKDEIPDFHFKVDEKIMRGTVLPHEKKTFSYIVEPKKRGIFNFGRLHVRYMGKLKFVMRAFRVDLNRNYKVYPNMKNLRKYRLTASKNRNFKEGQRKIKMLGRGTSFESLKEYVAGDDYRKINWNATARGQRIIINQYEPEKNQHVYIFIDSGRPMSYSVKGYRKLDLAVNTALVLSDIVNQNGDQSGLLTFNTDVSTLIMPGKGAGHRNKMMEALYLIDKSISTSNYQDAFYYFRRKEHHRSIIFIFTDFDTQEEAEGLIKDIALISKNNVVILILIRDEKIIRLSEKTIKTKKDLFDKGVALELLEDRCKAINLLNRKGVMCIECDAEKVELNAVNKYLQVKNRVYM